MISEIISLPLNQFLRIEFKVFFIYDAKILKMP